MITGQCKQDFEKWFLDKSYLNFSEEFILLIFEGYLNRLGIFNSLLFSMQYGVYVDFFDSFGMQIYVKPTVEEKWSVYIDFFGHHILTEYIYTKTRHGARTEAINKANEIYNEKHSN